MTGKWLSGLKRPDMSIELRDGNDCSKRSYSNGDLIEGEVLLHFHEDTIIGGINICFRGHCTSIVTDLQPWAREQPSTKTIHTFLVMQQPIEYQELPSNRLAKARSVHSIPFCFTVPSFLLSDACNHGLDPESPLSQAHRLLPPSLGTPDSKGHDNARVEYNIHACLMVRSSRDDSFRSVEEKMLVKVEPVLEPDSPTVVKDVDPDYQLRTEVGLSWRALRPSSDDGRLLLRTAESLPLQMSRMTRSDMPPKSPSTSTQVTTNLEFVPEHSLGHPPTLKSVKVVLRAFTYSASLPFLEAPQSSSVIEPTGSYNVCSEVVDLGDRIGKDLVWEKCEAESRSAPMYRASLVVPINLPGTCTKQKQLDLVPTFSSCLVARNYSLGLTYSFKRSSSTPVSGSPGAPEGRTNQRSSDEHANSAVTGIASKLRTLSKTRDFTLTVPLQIISRNDTTRDESRSCSSLSSVERCSSQQCATENCTLRSQLNLDPPPYTGKAAQTCHLESGWNESPPSYCSASHVGQNVARE